jgi:antitoxin component YwqK of YwqJK toxin-antitoxin module
MEERNFKYGIQDGKLTIWDENGQKESEINYKNVELID